MEENINQDIPAVSNVETPPMFMDDDRAKKKKRRRNACIAIIAALVLFVTGTVSSLVMLGKYLGEQMPQLNPFDNSEAVMPPTTRPDSGMITGPELVLADKPTDETMAMTVSEIYQQVSASVVMILGSSDAYMSLGTGIILSTDGYIATNAHIIEDVDEIHIVLNDNITTYDAVVIGYDVDSDLAVLKIDVQGLVAATLGDSDQAVVGEGVVTIGNPYRMAYAQTVTDGIISGVRRNVAGLESTTALLQTNAQLNPGNSGGPLINMYGQVIGINSSKIMYDGESTYEGLGFAIPMTEAKEIIDDLIQYGYIKPKPMIGITITYGEYHMQESDVVITGCKVIEIDKTCDAYKKGLRVGDIVVKMNGQSFDDLDGYLDEKNKFQAGDIISLTCWRDGEYFEIQAQLMEAK